MSSCTYCATCSESLTPDKEISCDLCRKFIHSTCSGLSRLEIQCLKAKDRKLTFYCPSCMDFKEQLASLNGLKETIRKLENEVNTLKSKSSTGPSFNVNSLNNLHVSEIIDELQDRQSRESNIIMFNLEEVAESDPKKRNEIESGKIASIISSIDDSINTSGIRFARLGKFLQGKQRPIKITLSSKSDVLKVLKKKRIINIPVKIHGDLTPMQRQHLSDLRAQLDELNRKGGNKTIKYIRGKPQIVDSKN